MLFAICCIWLVHLYMLNVLYNMLFCLHLEARSNNAMGELSLYTFLWYAVYDMHLFMHLYYAFFYPEQDGIEFNTAI